MKNFLKKWWFWLIVFFVLVFVLGSSAPKQTETLTPTSQIKEIKQPPSAACPKQKYFEESIVADGKSNTFILQNSYGDVTVRLNGEVQALGVQGDKYVNVIFLDVTSDSKAASKKLQFKQTPPESGIITVMGAVFHTQAPKPTEISTPIPKSTPTPTPTPTQQSQNWQTVNMWQGNGEKQLDQVFIGNRKLRIEISWSGREGITSELWGIWQCDGDPQYPSCSLMLPVPFWGIYSYTYPLDELPAEIIIRDKPMFFKVNADRNTTWTLKLQE